MIEHCAQNFFASKELSTGIMELVFCLISNAGNIKNVAMIENGNPISSINYFLDVWGDEVGEFFVHEFTNDPVELIAEMMGF